MTLLNGLIDVAADTHHADDARCTGGRALFDDPACLACLANGRRRALAGVSAGGAAGYGDLDDIHWSSLTHPGAIIWAMLDEGGVDDDRRWRRLNPELNPSPELLA